MHYSVRKRTNEGSLRLCNPAGKGGRSPSPLVNQIPSTSYLPGHLLAYRATDAGVHDRRLLRTLSITVFDVRRIKAN